MYLKIEVTAKALCCYHSLHCDIYLSFFATYLKRFLFSFLMGTDLLFSIVAVLIQANSKAQKSSARGSV